MNLFIAAAFAFLFSVNAIADITDQFRRSNAVVLYDFSDTDDTLRDKADPKFGAPLNLTRIRGTVGKSGNYWEFTNASQVRSAGPATKIYNQCRNKNEVSIEIQLSGNENVEKRTGPDTDGVLQPLRIVSYSRGLNNRNFTVGQTYDAGNMYAAAITTEENKDNSLTEPLLSSVDAISVANSQDGSGGMQKIIITFKNGLARMYLTDKDNNLFLHRSTANGFRGNLNSWDQNAYFMIGNEYISEDRFYSYNDQYGTCDNDRDKTCGVNPNRYWKGRLHLVAVYCQELTKEQIFGSQALQQVTNPVFPIDTSLQITPELHRAQDIYQRLTGIKTPIFNPALQQMAQKISANDAVAAAEIATQDPNFYNITVRDFAAKMSNRDETINVPLNDFTATVVGAVRDEINAQRLLYDNLVYIGDKSKAAVPANLEMDMIKSNNHYETLGSERFDLSRVLIPSTQKMFDGQKVVDNPTPAGLLTTRQWMAAHAIAGTNRRLVEFAFREFLCSPLEVVADSSGPDDVVARDIDRFPGGSHSKYTSNCRACHTILDGFRPAFAYFTFSNGIVKHSFISPNAANADQEDNGYGMQRMPAYVAKKLNHNETMFSEGRITTDDKWVNNAIYGSNASRFEWSKISGKGIREFGQTLAGSKQFPNCMARRAFVSLCKREPIPTDEAMLKTAAQEFSSTRNFNLKWLFQKIVTTKECLGEIQ